MIKRIPGTWGYFGADEDNHVLSSSRDRAAKSQDAPINARIIQKAKADMDVPIAYDPKGAKAITPKPVAPRSGLRRSPQQDVNEKDVSKAARKRAFQAHQKQQKEARQRDLFKANAGLLAASQLRTKLSTPKSVPKKPSQPKPTTPKQELKTAPQQESPNVTPTVTTTTTTTTTKSISADRPDLPFRLLDLPLEVRLSIFELVFDGAFVIMDDLHLFGQYPQSLFPCMSPHSYGIPFRTFPSLVRSPLMKWEPISILRGRHLGFIKPSNRGLQHNTGLLLTSKKVAREAAPVFYARSLLAFGSRKHVAKFLRMHRTSDEAEELVEGARIVQRLRRRDMKQNCRGPAALPRVPIIPNVTSSLKHICLEIRAYGEPSLLRDRPAYLKYYESWRLTCLEIVRRLPNLQDVAISSHVPIALDGKPCSLSLEALWVQPVLEFANCSKLETAAITLLLPYSGPGLTFETGQAFSEVLRRVVLQWDHASAFEALSEWKLRRAPTCCGARRATIEEWELVELANGLDPIEPDNEQEGLLDNK